MIKVLTKADFPDYHCDAADVTADRGARQKHGCCADLNDDQAALRWGAAQFPQKAFAFRGVDNINRETVMNFLQTQPEQNRNRRRHPPDHPARDHRLRGVDSEAGREVTQSPSLTAEKFVAP